MNARRSMSSSESIIPEVTEQMWFAVEDCSRSVQRRLIILETKSYFIRGGAPAPPQTPPLDACGASPPPYWNPEYATAFYLGAKFPVSDHSSLSVIKATHCRTIPNGGYLRKGASAISQASVNVGSLSPPDYAYQIVSLQRSLEGFSAPHVVRPWHSTRAAYSATHPVFPPLINASRLHSTCNIDDVQVAAQIYRPIKARTKADNRAWALLWIDRMRNASTASLLASCENYANTVQITAAKRQPQQHNVYNNYFN